MRRHLGVIYWVNPVVDRWPRGHPTPREYYTPCIVHRARNALGSNTPSRPECPHTGRPIDPATRWHRCIQNNVKRIAIQSQVKLDAKMTGNITPTHSVGSVVVKHSEILFARSMRLVIFYGAPHLFSSYPRERNLGRLQIFQLLFLNCGSVQPPAGRLRLS